MKEFTAEVVKKDLEPALEHAREGGTVIIIGDDDQAHRLVSTILPKKGPRKPGSAKGTMTLTDEFFEPLPEFEPYM